MGVVDAGDGKFEAVVELPGDRVLSGGLHASATDAARARDAVARMYLGDGVATNFEARASTAWAPEPLVRPGGGGDAPPLVPVLPGVKLTVDEVVLLLNAHAGVDVSSLDLAGKNDIAGFMVFVTGRTPGHMRRLADSVSDAARARAPYPGVRDVGVEDREGDYWMLVDLGDIIVNVFDAVAREAFAIEPWCARARAARPL
jgi:ribosome silencing factor RsfS/YbeB/iojap